MRRLTFIQAYIVNYIKHIVYTKKSTNRIGRTLELFLTSLLLVRKLQQDQFSSFLPCLPNLPRLYIQKSQKFPVWQSPAQSPTSTTLSSIPPYQVDRIMINSHYDELFPKCCWGNTCSVLTLELVIVPSRARMAKSWMCFNFMRSR